MDAKTDPPSTPVPTELSLVRGGPSYRTQQASRLTRPDRWNIGRRIAVSIVISWVPLLLITAFLNPDGLRSFLTDSRVYARLFIAIPALLIGEMVMDRRLREAFRYIRQADLLDPPDMEYMDCVVARLVRIRDSFLPELLILILIFVRIVLRYRDLVDTTPWLGHEAGAAYIFTAAGWYGLLVSAPLFSFLLALSLWRWLLWTFFTFQLSRRNLKLVATHPDKRGGLGFLGLTSSAFVPIAFATASVIASTWHREIVHHGAHVMNFKLPAIVLAVIIVLIALGPLIFFVPRLVVLRRRGILDYGILGQVHSADYHEKWISHRAGHEAEFLQAQETVTVTGFGITFEKIEGLEPFPANLASLYPLVAAVAIPALFVILTEIPLRVVIEDLLKAVH
jgi:hypothetical protein